MTIQKLVKMLDLASVKMDTTMSDIQELVDLAREWDIPQLCFNSANIPYAQKILENNGIPGISLIGTAGFPTGCFPVESKIAEINLCASYGCTEIDICSNQGFLKSEMLDEFEADISACVKAAHDAGMAAKIIVESASITPQQLKQSCEVVASCGAEFYKTSSGYMENKTLPIHISVIKSVVGNRCEIKAANGVRSYQQLLALYNEGCTRFGVGVPFVRDILRDCAVENDK